MCLHVRPKLLSRPPRSLDPDSRALHLRKCRFAGGFPRMATPRRLSPHAPPNPKRLPKTPRVTGQRVRTCAGYLAVRTLTPERLVVVGCGVHAPRPRPERYRASPSAQPERASYIGKESEGHLREPRRRVWNFICRRLRSGDSAFGGIPRLGFRSLSRLSPIAHKIINPPASSPELLSPLPLLFFLFLRPSVPSPLQV